MIYRVSIDNLHLSKLGLIEHGKRWADVVYNKMITAYEVSMDTNTKHGQISGEKSTYHAGDIVKVSVKADEGYYLKIGSFKVKHWMVLHLLCMRKMPL